MTESRAAPRRALLSVSDKSGLVDLARGLVDHGVELIASGGTRAALAAAGLPVVEVSDVTGSPEIMGGRVKTLHPKIHGGLLQRGGIDAEVLAAEGIAPIDLLVVNLYPFEATIERDGVTFEAAVEQIDIGGPAMIRAAAKNHERTLVVCEPARYDELLARLADGRIDAAWRRDLALAAFRHTAAYDQTISTWLAAFAASAMDGAAFAASAMDGAAKAASALDAAVDAAAAAAEAAWPERLTFGYRRVQALRYGENPHQSGALYRLLGRPAHGWARARQLQGKALSYNNIADGDAAWRTAGLFPEPVCVIVKHANPCGVALGTGPLDAYERAFQCDPASAFGGIIAFNRSLDRATVARIVANQFAEIVMAPEIAPDAAEVAAARKNLRLIEWGWDNPADPDTVLKPVAGGLLVQSPDLRSGLDAIKVASRRTPDRQEQVDLALAWRVATVVKSNAIVYASDGRTLGIGAGQMSRIDAARIGASKAADVDFTLAGAVMASDAFFPFRDSVDAAAAAGVKAIIQPGGSMRDQEVIDAADEHGIAMLFTGVRHFNH